MNHSSLRALIAIVFGVCVAIGGRTASAAPYDFTLTPTIVAQAMPASSPAPKKAAAPAPSPTATPAPAPPPKIIQFSGNADIGYAGVSSRTGFAAVQQAVGVNPAPVGISGRVFDNKPNVPLVQDIYIGSVLTAGPIGGGFDFAFGNDADVLESFPMSATDSWSIVQAFLSYTEKNVTLQVGKFNTLAGAELIKSSLDYEYSKSILNGNAIPFTHTGVRLTWAPSPKISYIVGENLGWDTINIQHTHGTTTEIGVAVNPSSATNLLVQDYQGKEMDAAGGFSRRRLLDAVLTGHVTPALTLVGNYDLGSQVNGVATGGGGFTTGRWQGGAGYANYAFTSKWSGTLRGEIFKDSGGFKTGVDQTWGEETVTAQYQPTPATMLRAEYRWDHSTQPIFATHDPSNPFTSGAGSQQQRGVGLEAIAKF